MVTMAMMMAMLMVVKKGMAMTMHVLMMRLFVLMQMLTTRTVHGGNEDADGGFECDGDADDDDDGCSDDCVVYGDVDD